MTKDKDNELNVVKGEFKEPRWANIPKMPRWLSPELKAEWRFIMKMLDKTALHPGDAIALSLLCGVMADHSRIKAEIKERGEVLERVQILSEYNELVMVWLREFLLTPASRNTLKAE